MTEDIWDIPEFLIRKPVPKVEPVPTPAPSNEEWTKSAPVAPVKPIRRKGY